MKASKSSGQTPAVKELKEKKSTGKPSKNQKRISSVLIKVSQGKTHADDLGKLREELNPDAPGSRL